MNATQKMMNVSQKLQHLPKDVCKKRCKNHLQRRIESFRFLVKQMKKANEKQNKRELHTLLDNMAEDVNYMHLYGKHLNVSIDKFSQMYEQLREMFYNVYYADQC